MFYGNFYLQGKAGKLVSLEASLEGGERILNDQFYNDSEGALYMLGSIDEAKKKAEGRRSRKI